MTASLYLLAFWQIVRFEYFLRKKNFALLYRKVREFPLAAVRPPLPVERITMAIDVVCICYPKRVLCLQRSAATTCLLRSHGIPALLVIGTQQIPFQSHAWVETNGRVANDKPYVAEIYAVLDRC